MNQMVEQDIRIAVQTAFVASQSDPDEDRYVFAYTITITNAGAITVQLMTRHWIITDAQGRVQEVRGDGVVGVQPHLQPGESFEYTSGAVLETPVGSMQGHYRMIDDTGAGFDVEIPGFSLSVPQALN